MKKIVVALIAILCTSCYPYLTVQFKVIDFSAYTAKGFYLTPATSINQKYLPLGEVSLLITNYLDGRKNLNAAMIEEIESDIVFQNLAKHFNLEKTDLGLYDYAICNLINKAMNFGGDGILGLTISEGVGQNGCGELYISGFAIRRE